MRLTVTRALDLAGSDEPRDVLYRRAVFGSDFDPEIGRLVAAVLCELWHPFTDTGWIDHVPVLTGTEAS